jgi:hypothetical protein
MYEAIGVDATLKENKKINRMTTELLCLAQALQINKLEVTSSLV